MPIMDILTKAGNRAKAVVAKVLAEVTAKLGAAAMAVAEKEKARAKPGKDRRILVLGDAAQNRKTQFKKDKTDVSKPTIACRSCGEKGHRSSDCTSGTAHFGMVQVCKMSEEDNTNEGAESIMGISCISITLFVFLMQLYYYVKVPSGFVCNYTSAYQAAVLTIKKFIKLKASTGNVKDYAVGAITVARVFVA